MRIAILIDLLVPGGVQKAAIQEARTLKGSGHRARLFCLTRSQSPYQYQDLLKDLKITYLSDQNPSPFRKALKLPFFTFLTTNHLLGPLFAKRYRALKKYDLVISHGTTTCLTALRLKRVFGLPYLAFIWDPMAFILHKVYKNSPLRPLFPIIDKIIHALESKILANAASVITPSAVHQTHLKNRYGLESKIIPPGHDFPPPVRPKKRKYFLGFSRWQKEKDPHFFLEIASKTKHPVLVAGVWTNPEELEKFKHQIRRRKLNIKIKEKVTRRDIPLLAEKAIAWIHPNFEAFGMPGLELASQGVPILIPKGSGVAELFENGVHGFFPEKERLPEAIRKLDQNPSFAKKMGKAAAKRAQKYTWEIHTKTLRKVIENSLSKTPITVLHNSFVTQESIGGGDQFMIEIGRRMTNRKITVITPKIGHFHWTKKGKKTHLSYRILPRTRFDGNQSPAAILLAYLHRSWKTVQALNKLPKPGILVSATELTPDIFPAFCYKKRNPETRWISRIFHLIPPPWKREGNPLVNMGSWLLQRLSLVLMRSCDRVLVDNPNLKKELAEIGIQKEKISIQPGGVEVEKIKNYKPKTKQQFAAAFVGRLIPHKGVFDLVPIWKKATKANPQARLAVVGTGPDQINQKLESQIEKAKLKKNIRLLGFLEHQKNTSMPLFDVLKNSKVLLFTDHEAGFGLIILEAMAAGLPVVAYDLPIFGKIFKKGFLTAPLSDIEALSQQVLKLLKDELLYKKLSREASAQAAQFGWSNPTRKLEKLIDSLQA